MKHILENNKVCAIMRNVPLEKTLDYAEAVYKGGIHMFEVAMNSPEAVKQIEMMRNRFGDQAFVGAGTVINQERCREARAAGAQFFLTPSAVVGTMEFCRNHEIPLLPGVLTPTDVTVCLEYGYSVMKLFPAGEMPRSYIKSLKGPFDGTEYVAVGGVTADNIRELLNQGFIGVGIGSNLIPKDMVKDSRWEAAAEYVSEIVRRARQ
ncbi:MAG: bifunctional 4-hydroxy-2-oxoglutarate aldolase/2-dehydro-3-deoxy-phosphogluconate aldolase [Clostridium sp.]|nr:bifunctional 4-hydroxy-2-oxoglutarate aldolase/2-dehydro-3-deoxy-phosphogluconate aldolase [Clostridium sp.]